MTLVLSESFEDSKRKTFDFFLELSPSIATPQATKRQRCNCGRVNDWIMWSCHDWTCCIQELTLFPFDIRVVWALCGYPWLLYYGLSCTFNPLRDLLGGFSIDRRGAGSKKNHDGFTDLWRKKAIGWKLLLKRKAYKKYNIYNSKLNHQVTDNLYLCNHCLSVAVAAVLTGSP